jgi:hypothetical protein
MGGIADLSAKVVVVRVVGPGIGILDNGEASLPAPLPGAGGARSRFPGAVSYAHQKVT